MENLDIEKRIQNTYYLHSAQDFSRLSELVHLMPNYATKSESQFTIIDYFYETPENFLQQLDSSIRIRVVGDHQTLSIVCKHEGIRREFETEMNFGDKIQDRDEYIMFLDDKLQDIYTHQIDIDIPRILKGLKVFLYITTSRRQLEIINNTGFDAFVNFDSVLFSTKRHNVGDNILEVKLNCLKDIANMTAYNRFVHTLEQKVMLTPMDETKFDAGKRIFRSEY